MALSRRDTNGNMEAVDFDPAVLGAALRAECPEVSFALLMGSGRDGHIPPGGDLDLAVSVTTKFNLKLLEKISAVAGRILPGVPIDLGSFDRAEPIYRFEALKGRLLFARDLERYLDAFSRTCREYESQIYDYERQARYRLKRKETAA